MTIALVGWWLAVAESSPFHPYFLRHTDLPNVLAIFNLPAILIGTAISGNVHQASEVVTAIASAVQWFAIGYFASIGFISDAKDAEND
jgi:hypothetical protein